MRLNRFGKFNSLGVLSWPLVVGALVLASCGSDTATGSSASTISLDATSYIVKDPVTTTTIGAEGAANVVEEGQTYVVQSGDYPVKVAEQFGVPLDDLLSLNGWSTSSEFAFPGEEIKIPAGGTAPVAEDDTLEAAAGADEEAAAGESIPASGSNCEPGSYTIEAGDFEGRVAGKFDVTVDALRAANAGTTDYSIFYVGLKIVIPAKSDC